MTSTDLGSSSDSPAAADTITSGRRRSLVTFRRRMSRLLGRESTQESESHEASPEAPSNTASSLSTRPQQQQQQQQQSDTSSYPFAPPQSLVPAPPPEQFRDWRVPNLRSLALDELSLQPGTAYKVPRQVRSSVDHKSIQEEKWRAMLAKYNMTLEISGADKMESVIKVTSAGPDSKRAQAPQFVEKKVRMRVHRTCHRCQATFGADRLCTRCNHTRCKKCPGLPTPSGGGAVGEQQKLRRGKPIQTASVPAAQHPSASSTTIAKWACHECDNVHRVTEKECLRCGHASCSDCRPHPAHSSTDGTAAAATPAHVTSGQDGTDQSTSSS